MTSRVCYVCSRFVEEDHVCPEAERILENPKELSAPWIHSAAIPSVIGPQRHAE